MGGVTVVEGESTVEVPVVVVEKCLAALMSDRGEDVSHNSRARVSFLHDGPSLLTLNTRYSYCCYCVDYCYFPR